MGWSIFPVVYVFSVGGKGIGVGGLLVISAIVLVFLKGN